MLKHQKTKDILWIIGGTLLFAVLAGLFSVNSGAVYRPLAMPPLAPPPWLFGVVWPILYALMALSAIFIKLKAPAGAEKKEALATYWLQLIANAVWPALFFLMQVRFISFLWLVLLFYLVLLLFVRCFRLYRLSAWLLIPYILWLAFAAYLNYFIWFLNR